MNNYKPLLSKTINLFLLPGILLITLTTILYMLLTNQPLTKENLNIFLLNNQYTINIAACILSIMTYLSIYMII
jgi:hypothetical protein